jgi:predicted regulator of Ras-like GTPase activity (Roadblock/LC7/MglB family)
METMPLDGALDSIPTLLGLFVTIMPDCLLYDSWMRVPDTWTPEEVASYFGDLIRSNRAGLKALRSWTEEMQVTIEASEHLLVLREVGEQFVIGFVFARNTPLGLVRLHISELMTMIEEHLPSSARISRPRAQLIMDFLERYAPDPHAVIMRVALMTGIPPAELREGDDFTQEQTDMIEEAAKRILGIDQLAL